MKKLFIVTLAVLFFAGAAYAVEYDYSGMINTRGSWINNSGSTSDDSEDYMYYDMEFDSTLNIRPSDKSLIRLNWEIHDENFDESPTDSQDKTGDDQIAFKRAWGKYTFDNGMSTTFGLMTGGAFGTAFGDNANGLYRVRLDGAASVGNWGVILEKRKENGPNASGDWDAEKDDSDAYYAYFLTKAGDVNLQFLGIYSLNGDVTGGAIDGGYEFEDPDQKVMGIIAATNGVFGNFGFEGEATYRRIKFEWSEDAGPPAIPDTPGGEDEADVYGLYGNVWMNMDAMKIGLMAAYASYDDDAGVGYGMGEDFGPGYWVMDWDAFGSGNAEYYAATLVAIYADYSVNDALSLYGALEYMSSNEEDTEWDGATGMIGNFGLTYKLADNVKYQIGAAYGKYKDGEWIDDDGDEYDNPDAFGRAFHKITVSF